jgi:5-methylthioadenosine/S-adenosylhomocysteine deaminase
VTEPADLLIEARQIAPVAPANTVFEAHGVALRDGRIVGFGPAAELRSRFTARERVVRSNHLLCPGFVNAHTQAAGVLLRGLPVYPPQMRWLRETLEPAEQRLVSPDFVRDGTRLAIAEMLRAGITTFADQSPFPDASARAVEAARVRAVVGIPLSDTSRLWDEYKSSPWVSLQFAPEPPYAVSDAALTKLRGIADEVGEARIAMSVHQSEVEVRDSLAHHGRKPLRRMADLGLLRPGFTALHMNRLDEEDLDLAAYTGIAVVACPQSDLRLGGGMGPVAALLGRGVTVGLGTDSPVSAGALDLLSEARAAALFAAGLGSAGALRLATLDGATALGLGSVTGSIEVGKAADLVCIELSSPSGQPPASAFDDLLFGATRTGVRDVWVGGRAAVTDGRLIAFDEEELAELAHGWAKRVHAGATA